MADPLLVGRVGGPHGIRGWSVLSSLTDPVDNILNYKPLLLKQGGRWRPLEDVEFSRKGKKLLIRIGSHQDRTIAESMRGLELGLAADDLPAPDSEEFYWRDLIGLQAIAADGRPLGRVVRLLDTPAHDVLVVVPAAEATMAGDANVTANAPANVTEGAESGHGERDPVARETAEPPEEVLVPFVDAFTGAIDLVAGTIVIDWPEFEVAGPPAPTADASGD